MLGKPGCCISCIASLMALNMHEKCIEIAFMGRGDGRKMFLVLAMLGLPFPPCYNDSRGRLRDLLHTSKINVKNIRGPTYSCQQIIKIHRRVNY